MLTSAIQESLVALLLFDTDKKAKYAKLVAGMLRAKNYDPYYADFAEKAIEYITKYRKAPGEHAIDLLNTIVSRRQDSREIYKRIYKSIQQTSRGVNAEYVLAQASLFTRVQRVKAASQKAVQSLQGEVDEQKITEAESALLAITRSDITLFQQGTRLDEAMRKGVPPRSDGDFFPTGIGPIDETDLMPARKRMWILMSLSGMGKSWYVTHQAIQNLRHHTSTLLITTEMPETQVVERCMQTLLSLTKRKEQVSYSKFQKAGDEITGIKHMELNARPALRDENIGTLLTRKAKNVSSKPPLIVKEFPSGTLTIPKLKAYMEGLEHWVNFIPDMLIVDYPDLMDFDPKFERQEIDKIYVDLRGIAIERNMAVVAPTQANRAGEGAPKLTKKHVGLSYGKYKTADVFVTYNQTEPEAELGLARLEMEKGRGDRDKFTVMISQAYSIGQFCMDAVRMPKRSYWSLVKDETGEDVQAVAERAGVEL